MGKLSHSPLRSDTRVRGRVGAELSDWTEDLELSISSCRGPEGLTTEPITQIQANETIKNKGKQKMASTNRIA